MKRYTLYDDQAISIIKALLELGMEFKAIYRRVTDEEITQTVGTAPVTQVPVEWLWEFDIDTGAE